MSDDGTGTAPDNAGASTGDADSQGAGKQFTEAQMAAARKSWKFEADKAATKRVQARERELLDQFDIDDWTELQETLEGKRSEQTELETQLKEAKREARRLKNVAADYERLQSDHAALQDRVNRQAMRTAVYDVAKGIDAHERAVYSMLVAESRLGVDEDGNVFVRGDDGEPAQGNLETTIKTLVADNPFLQRATQGAGGGSRPPAGTAPAPNGGLQGGSWQDEMRAATRAAYEEDQFGGRMPPPPGRR